MKNRAVRRLGRTILLLMIVGPTLWLSLGASRCLGSDAADAGAPVSVRTSESVSTPPAGKVAVCHNAGGRWLPISLPVAAAERHVRAHGDFRYDASTGQCCIATDCANGQPCRIVVGDDGNPTGVCGSSPPTGVTTDPVGLLLAAGIFGPSSGATFPFSGVLLRTDADQYFLSFTVGGISAKVQLAAFQFTGTTIPTAAPTLVSITFPSRNDGLITGPPDYLNFSVATQYLSGTAKVALDNGNAFYNPNYGTATFDLSSGGTYDLSVTGTYTSPIPSPNGGNFPAGLYLDLPNGTIVVNVMVFRGDAYKVNLS